MFPTKRIRVRGKRKKSNYAPTKNPFWAKIIQTGPDQTANNKPNQSQQSEPTTSTTQTASNPSKAAECVDENKSKTTIDTNPSDSDSKLSDEASQSSQGNIDFTEDLTEGEIQQWQNKNMQSSNSGSSSMENQGSNTVVRGVASKIMFIMPDSKKSVELAPKQTPKMQQNVWGNKQIESRITRNKQTIDEQQQAIALQVRKDAIAKLVQQSKAQLAPPHLAPQVTPKVVQQAVPPKVVQQAVPPPRVQAPEIKVPKGFVANAAFVYNYPKGIPRSFYEKPSAQTPEPYSQFAKPQGHPLQTTSNWQLVNTPPDMNAWPPNMPYQQPPLFDLTADQPQYPQAYSPSDVYTDNLTGLQNDEDELELDLEDPSTSQKRQSAFDRLGPVSQPKKPKLTINLLFNKEQAIREVVDSGEKSGQEEPEKEKYVPLHLREDILASTDPTVVKYINFWPWKKPVARVKSVTLRNSKSVMLLEKEQIEELYDKNNVFFSISVKGYPPTWRKENVLDTLLDNFPKLIPIFIEFTPQECQFFVIRSRVMLLAIHKAGFIVRKDGVELTLTISSTNFTLTHITFIPKLVLRKIMALQYDGNNCMNLSSFTIKEDISNFIYFPLSRPLNQMSLAQYLQTTFEWENITELILSHNKLTSIEDFSLAQTTPKLKRLDLSYNEIDNVKTLISIRDLGLRSIVLEGNPLCNDYIDSEHYVKVLKLMFSSLQEIDGIPIRIKGEMPPFKQHYCPEDAKPIIDKFIEVYFPLLEASEDDRVGIDELYHEKASMTITYRFKLRYSNIYRYFRSIFHRCRMIDEGDEDSVNGASEIAKHIEKWPPIVHDPCTFTIDVLHHDDFATAFKVAGMLKLTSDSLAEDEHLLAFTKTFVLQSYDGSEYKITNEMVYWDVPTTDYADNAFQVTRTLKQKKLSLMMESTPEDDLKEGLLQIFMQLTDLNKNASERCLEQKSWNLKMALDYFMKLLKLDDLESLTKEIKN